MTDSKKPTPPASGHGAASPVGGAAPSCPTGCPGGASIVPVGKKWGWDDYTDPAVPWLSIQTGASDTVQVKASSAADSGKMCNVEYASSDASIATVAPAKGTGDNEVLTISGKSKGEVTVSVKCGGGTLATLKVVVKNLLRKKIALRVVHETNYTSTGVADAVVVAFVDQVYKQAVTKLEITRLAAVTVPFDRNGDGMIKVTGPWPGPELRKVIAAAKDPSYDFNVFWVDNPDDDSLGWSEFSNVQKSCVVHIKSLGRADAVATQKTIAHEGGHGLFGLKHPWDYGGNPAHLQSDPDNLMSQGDSASMKMLRKYQWDIRNP